MVEKKVAKTVKATKEQTSKLRIKLKSYDMKMLESSVGKVV
jgi:ribosomal protein S10